MDAIQLFFVIALCFFAVFITLVYFNNLFLQHAKVVKGTTLRSDDIKTTKLSRYVASGLWALFVFVLLI